MAPHFLSPPFHLPDGRDGRLVGYLRDDDWGSATTLLRDVVSDDTTDWKWLVLLAYVRFRDASDVLPDELTDAAREALSLLERAMQHGAPHDEIAPFRQAVEDTLDQLSRGEEALLGKLKAGDDASALSDEELENVAVLVGRSQPHRAARLFLALAERQQGDAARLSHARAALLDAQVGFEGVKTLLDEALTWDWSKRPLADDRLTLEGIETALLEHATGADFVAQWQLATERGQALGFPFPAAWPHQERLLRRLLHLRDSVRARALAARIESERTELPRQLAERVKAAQFEQV